MKRSIIFSSALVVISVAIHGCGSPAGSDSATSPIQTATDEGSGEHGHHDHGGSDHGGHAHGDHDHGDGTGPSDMEKIKVELAKLSPEDAKSAEEQHFCPVTGDMLGAMGAPIKVDVDGQQVWICCEGCRDSLLEEPEKYLAKLKNEADK